MKLTAIVAMTEDRLIGQGGALPWHLPEDLQFFKKTTTGQAVLMGRATFDSILHSLGKALPNRHNLVLTRDPTWQHPDAAAIQSKEQLKAIPLENKQLYIIGGAQVYELFLPDLDELLITHVHQPPGQPYTGDTYFPPYEQLFPHSEIISTTADFTIKRHIRA